jgi:hypothetical protein
MTDEEKEQIAMECYKLADTDISPEIFVIMLDCLETVGYTLKKNRVTAWNHPVIDLTPLGEDRFVLRTDLPMVLEKTAKSV